MRLARLAEIDGRDSVDVLVKLAEGWKSLAKRGKDARNMHHASVSVCRRVSDGYHVSEPLYNELIGEYPTEDTEPGAATSKKESGAATPVANVGNLEYKMNIDTPITATLMETYLVLNPALSHAKTSLVNHIAAALTPFTFQF